jgi:hypothetical protein
MRHFGAGSADDPGRLGELSCDKTVIERRQEFPLGEVARAAEDDIVKWLDRNELAAHDTLSLAPRGRFNLIDLKKPVARREK